MLEVEKMYNKANVNFCFSKDKKEKIKNLLNAIDVGLTNFNYGIICNHQGIEGFITGFEGQGSTETECYANLINNIWDYLTNNEKQTIINILKEESK